jgi:hypothetical protein
VIEEKWAQMERLEALEHTDLPSSIATVTPRFHLQSSCLLAELIHWFSGGSHALA